MSEPVPVARRGPGDAAGHKVWADELYGAYREWAERTGEQAFSQRDLGVRLKEKGLENKRGAKGRRLWVGVRRRPGDADPGPETGLFEPGSRNPASPSGT